MEREAGRGLGVEIVRDGGDAAVGDLAQVAAARGHDAVRRVLGHATACHVLCDRS
jgi:hypothetical protein